MKIKMIIALLGLVFISHAQVEKSVQEAKGLNIGEKAPMFKAIDANREEKSLSSLLKKGPVVLIFYRGLWCPFCNKHLATIQDSLSLVQEKGATVIAISPQNPDFLDEMSKNTGAQFELLFDEDYKIADAFDVAFKPEKPQVIKYNTFLNAKLNESHKNATVNLPIPATFIINKDGIIVWRHFDPNYKKRSSVLSIVKALEDLN